MEITSTCAASDASQINIPSFFSSLHDDNYSVLILFWIPSLQTTAFPLTDQSALALQLLILSSRLYFPVIRINTL